MTLLADLREAGWEAPAILISGHLTNEWTERALARGYTAAFTKPIGDSVLIKCLERLLPAGPPEKQAD